MQLLTFSDFIIIHIHNQNIKRYVVYHTVKMILSYNLIRSKRYHALSDTMINYHCRVSYMHGTSIHALLLRFYILFLLTKYINMISNYTSDSFKELIMNMILWGAYPPC